MWRNQTSSFAFRHEFGVFSDRRVRVAIAMIKFCCQTWNNQTRKKKLKTFLHKTFIRPPPLADPLECEHDTKETKKKLKLKIFFRSPSAHTAHQRHIIQRHSFHSFHGPAPLSHHIEQTNMAARSSANGTRRRHHHHISRDVVFLQWFMTDDEKSSCDTSEACKSHSHAFYSRSGFSSQDGDRNFFFSFFHLSNLCWDMCFHSIRFGTLKNLSFYQPPAQKKAFSGSGKWKWMKREEKKKVFHSTDGWSRNLWLKRIIEMRYCTTDLTPIGCGRTWYAIDCIIFCKMHNRFNA